RLIIALQSLREKYIIWPCDDYQKKVNQEFEILGFPIAIKAIDGTHIPLNEAPSKINKDIYMSRKHRYGIYLQGIVDHKRYFISYNIDPQSLNTEKQKYYDTIHSKARVVIKQGQNNDDDPIELELETFKLDNDQFDDNENNSEDKNNAKIKQQNLLKII
ncbi:30047_t:CDS:2, partial [Racocetra persica]